MRICILSDSPTIPTGYRNQATQLVKHLKKKGHEIIYFANGYTGSDLDKITFAGGETFEMPIIGHDGNNAYFHKTMSMLLKKYQPDWFIILLDTFMLFQTGFLNIDTSPAKTMFWFPSDGGGGMPKQCEAILKKIDVPVAMARFGQKQVKDYYNIDVEHIPHGLDVKSFFPLPKEQRDKIKARYGMQGKYVIGVVARNQPRKNLDRTIKSMRLIADLIPNAVLFLHLDPHDPAQGAWTIPNLVKKYNLENRVVYSGMSCFQGFPQSEMNNVYNAMDCFLLTTSGEGFGVPIIEAMACQIPVIATDYTTTPELVLQNNAGLGIKLSGVNTVDLDFFDENAKDYDIKVFDGTLTGSWEVERGFCSIQHCAEQVKWLYDHPEEAEKMGQNGRAAVLEKYDFEVVGKQFEELLNGTN